jgi:hypothetical protein
MFKQTFLIFLSAIIFQNSFAQDSLLYKNKVDSILVSRSKSAVKTVKVKNDSFRIRYFFKKDTHELAVIEVEEEKGKDIVIYNYHYIDGKIVMISKYINHPSRDKMKETAFYYLKNGVSLYRTENNTQIEGISRHIERANELKNTAPSN